MDDAEGAEIERGFSVSTMLLVARLAKMSPIEYAQCKAEYAKNVGVKVSDLDKEVREYRKLHILAYKKSIASTVDRENGKPVIRVLSGNRHGAADDGLRALVSANVEIYQRDKTLVRAILTKAKAANGDVVEVPGIVPVTLPILARELGKAAEWERLTAEGDIVRIDPPKDVVEQIFSMTGEWPFRPLSGVIGTPTLRPDGSILATPGYDDATGLVLLSSLTLPPIPAAPTKLEAAAALATLTDLLDEFPFEIGVGDNQDLSKSVAVSMILTTVLRGALLPAVPMHIVTAPQPGTGKSYLLDIAAVIATGERCPVIAVAPKEEETEKRLAGAALSGLSIIALDNVSDTLKGDFLAQVTERPILQIRALGGSAITRIANTFTVFANGNNVSATADLVRRTLRCGLDADVENPEEREFTEDPLAKVLADRGKYVAACLTIARAFLSDPEAKRCRRLPSFPAWSDLVRSALVWLTWPDPVASMDMSRAEDPTRQARADMFSAMRDCFGTGLPGATTAEIIAKANETNDMLPGVALNAELKEAVMAISRDRQKNLIDPDRLGKWLRSSLNMRSGNLKLLINRQNVKKPRWYVVESYGAQGGGMRG